MSRAGRRLHLTRKAARSRQLAYPRGGLPGGPLPLKTISSPIQGVAPQKGVGGDVYWFHRQLDYRSLTKSAWIITDQDWASDRRGCRWRVRPFRPPSPPPPRQT